MRRRQLRSRAIRWEGAIRGEGAMEKQRSVEKAKVEKPSDAEFEEALRNSGFATKGGGNRGTRRSFSAASVSAVGGAGLLEEEEPLLRSLNRSPSAAARCADGNCGPGFCEGGADRFRRLIAARRFGEPGI